MAPNLTRVIASAETAEVGVADRLRRLRQAHDLTQDRLARLAGTNQAVIQKIENGNSTRPRCLWEPYACREAPEPENLP